MAINNEKVSSVFIIAEAGVNHNGNLDIAKKLIDAAADAKADAVKFQTFKAENLTIKSAKQARYQIENIGEISSQYEMLKNLELDWEDHKDLFNYATGRNIKFLSTPFDNDSIFLLEKLGVSHYKIPSGEILSVPYLRSIAKLNKPTILSTGMATLEEVKQSIKILISAGLSQDNLSILHANTAYPTPYKDVNLSAMLTLKDELNMQVGLSDHSLGIEVPIAAVALGARIIEKHFTLDKAMQGPDHKASLEPDELKNMVSSIRHIEAAIGDGIKQPSISEKANITPARKSIVAKCNIKKGTLFTELNLTIKRPGGGISPLLWDNIIGEVATQNYQQDELINIKNMENTTNGKNAR